MSVAAAPLPLQDDAMGATHGMGADGGLGLRLFLLDRYKRGLMPASTLASLCWHATRAGASNVADLACKPDSVTAAADHVRRAISARAKSTFYIAQVPMKSSGDEGEQRRLCEFPMNLPHDDFARQYKEAPDEFNIALHADTRVPPGYSRHPVVHAKGALACPVGLFSDGVPHTKRDSFIAWYWSNLLSTKRTLICAVRKQDLCDCSCRGLCTIGAIQRVLAWSFNLLAEGVHPTCRHDQSPFPLRDDRQAKAGTALAGGFCGVLVEMRADLLEFWQACGFKNWRSANHPCFCCVAPSEQLWDFPASIAASEWPERDEGVYMEQIDRALVKRNVASRDLLHALVTALKFDTRKDGWGGLVLLRDFVDLDLSRGMRLVEAGPVHELDKDKILAIALPAELTFFDCKADSGLSFVCPLFDIFGFSVQSLALDVMHVLDLGVTQYLIGAVFMRLVENNFAGVDMVYVGMRRHENMKQLRLRLGKYYKSLHRARGTMSAVGNLTYAMLSSVQQPRLKAKAAESRNLVPLLTQLCEEHFASLGDRAANLKCACEALHSFYQTMNSEPRQMSDLGLRKLQGAMSRFLAHWKAFGGHLVFKHHMAWHLAERAGRLGNPKFYWTYADEQENRVMGSVARSLHGGNTFYVSFLQKVLPEACR